MVAILFLGLGFTILAVPFVGILMFLSVAFSPEDFGAAAKDAKPSSHVGFDVVSVRIDSALDASESRIQKLVADKTAAL